MTERLVLIVDDDAAIRGVIRAVLEADYFHVLEAADGHSALAMLAGSPNGDRPTVLVLDVMMPGIDGIEVCRQIDHQSTRVLMLTARDDETTRRLSKEAGADAFLAKPFSAVELLDAVESLLVR